MASGAASAVATMASPPTGSGGGGDGGGGRWYVDSDQGWIPVDDQYDRIVEGALRRGDGTVRVNTGGPFSYTVRFLNAVDAQQTNDSTRRVRSLRRLPLTDYVWQFQDTGVVSSSVPWSAYRNSELLEEEYVRRGMNAELVILSTAGEPVHIDLGRLVERNCLTGTTRGIRRVLRAVATGQDDNDSAVGKGVDPDVTVWRRLSASESSSVQDDCAICHDPMGVVGEHVVELRGCSGHIFHRECIRPVLKRSGSLKCPICSRISGEPHMGNQPPGTMTVTTNRGGLGIHGLDGHGVIVINYRFPSGVQGPEHPSPGTRYEGTQRVAYLPDTAEGQEVLRLLQTAWERKLIFTVGQSITTGQPNCVIWNGIHHKTSTQGGPYGYPDETYLARVKDELASKGVNHGGDP